MLWYERLPDPRRSHVSIACCNFLIIENRIFIGFKMLLEAWKQVNSSLGCTSRWRYRRPVPASLAIGVAAWPPAAGPPPWSGGLPQGAPAGPSTGLWSARETVKLESGKVQEPLPSDKAGGHRIPRERLPHTGTRKETSKGLSLPAEPRPAHASSFTLI